MLPRSMSNSHSPKRTGKGRFKPISSRSASTRSGVACVPSCAVAGSPGITSKARKTRKATARMVTIMDMNFRIRSFMEISFRISVRH